MKTTILVVGAPLALFCAAALAAPQTLSHADEVAAFKAAGFKLKGKQWINCEDAAPSYTAGTIAEVRDLNGDGRPEAVITEGSTNCFGMNGTAYSLVSKQANGDWRLVGNGTGIPTFLATKGVGGWPDIEVGGPGFCFPVERWNGRKFVFHRNQYEGKACRPN